MFSTASRYLKPVRLRSAARFFGTNGAKRDGKPVARTRQTSFNATVPGEYQVIGVADDGTVEREGADSAFVLGVDGAVAVGIAQTDGICAAVGSVECHNNV